MKEYKSCRPNWGGPPEHQEPGCPGPEGPEGPQPHPSDMLIQGLLPLIPAMTGAL